MRKDSGRKSADSLGVVPVVEILPKRPDPPDDLSPEEAAIWRQTVDSMRADWAGGEMLPLLRCYVAEVVLAEHWHKALRAIDMDADPKGFARVARYHRDASKTVMLMASRLRLTPRSNRSPKDLRERRLPRPWEPDPA
jgi:hypothetical protein